MERNKMILSLSLVVTVFICAAIGFSKDKPVESKWVAAPPSIDGMNTEWADASFASYKKAGIDYAFMNDAENLFIMFIYRNPRYVSSLKWTGLTVWIGQQGEKEKNLGINLRRKQISADDYIAILEKQVGQEMPEDRKAQIRQNKAYWMFEQRLINKNSEGYSKDAEPPVFQGAEFRNNETENAVVFEISISLSKLAEAAPGFVLEPGKAASLNFEWGGATKEYKEALAGRLAQSETRAGSQDTSGLTDERGGGGLGSAENDSVKLASMRRQLQQVKQYDFWVDLNLAQEK